MEGHFIANFFWKRFDLLWSQYSKKYWFQWHWEVVLFIFSLVQSLTFSHKWTNSWVNNDCRELCGINKLKYSNTQILIRSHFMSLTVFPTVKRIFEFISSHAFRPYALSWLTCPFCLTDVCVLSAFFPYANLCLTYMPYLPSLIILFTRFPNLIDVPYLCALGALFYFECHKIF